MRTNERRRAGCRFPVPSCRMPDAVGGCCDEASWTRQLIKHLNEDLSREYQAIIAYVVYSQVLKGAEYMNIASELEVHAAQELQHAITIAKYLGGMPSVTADAGEEHGQTQGDAAGGSRQRSRDHSQLSRASQSRISRMFSLSANSPSASHSEQEHLIDLATALGIEVPDVSAMATARWLRVPFWDG